MFETLDIFTLFSFLSVALIVLAIAFEDKLTALEKKHEAKHAKKETTIKEVRSNENRGAAKSA